MKFLMILVFGLTLLFGAVDINHASKSELMSLKGVGAKKADAILSYRKANCFKNVNELMKVKGIGPKFIDKNKKNLVVTKCKR